MNKNDLRYRKTEANLNQAYLSLLATQDCNSITVSQLCTLAQCARNTFYQHYPDLQTLKDHIIGQVLDDMANAFRNPGVTLNQIDTRESKRYVDNIATSIDNQRQTLQILVAKDDGTFQKQLENVIYTQVLAGDRMLSNVADTAINRLNAAYLAAAVAGFIARWLAEPTITTEVAKQTLLTMHQHTIATSTAYLATDPRQS